MPVAGGVTFTVLTAAFSARALSTGSSFNHLCPCRITAQSNVDHCFWKTPYEFRAFVIARLAFIQFSPERPPAVYVQTKTGLSIRLLPNPHQYDLLGRAPI